jgi:hypothetical protein
MTSVPPTFPTNAPSTLEFNPEQLATQFNSTYLGYNSWVDPTNASILEAWAASHLPADGLTPIEYDPIIGDTFTSSSLVPDAEGTLPQFLEVNSRYVPRSRGFQLSAHGRRLQPYQRATGRQPIGPRGRPDRIY